jgi:uncharacterized membrane protein YgcG
MIYPEAMWLNRIFASCVLSLLAICISLPSSVSGQQVTPTEQPAAPAAPVTSWPQQLDAPDGLITLYQPQPTKLDGNTLTARAAVSLTLPNSADPQFGAMWFTAQVFTDRDARTVQIQNVAIRQIKLPNSTPDQEKQFSTAIEQHVPSMNLMLSLDQLESTLGLVQKEREEAKQLDNSPPKIVFASTPTTLVVLDGPPKLQETQTQGVMAVINTPFILLFDMQSKRYFLKAGDTWMVATDVTGQWQPAGTDVPPGVLDAGSKLAAQQAPAPPQASPQPSGPTQILLTEQPAELIVSTGQPTYAPIVGNDLLYMNNTESDVFMEVASQQYYVLLSGRWFTSKSLQGPWTYNAPDKLPPSFAQIPPDSPKAGVLVAVANTQQAQDARLDAYIPQTTAVRRDVPPSVAVTYDGDPQFALVQDSQVTYSSNCNLPVFNVNNGYYCCDQAVWYQASSPLGPWNLCLSVPAGIYTLPPSCPYYNCRYCYVYGATPEAVYCGYLPGYLGSYVYGGTVVYGTGFNYPFWYGHRFFARPYTWGFGARYDYHAGMWGYGAAARYHRDWLANRAEQRGFFGPQGYVDYHEIRDRNQRAGVENTVHTEARNVTINRINIYNRQENLNRNVASHNQAIATPRNTRPGNAQPARELPRQENNVYAGPNGEVYRRTDQGWETRDAKGWAPYHPAEKARDHTQAPPANPADRQAHPEHQAPVERGPSPQTPARETPAPEAPAQVEPAHEAPVREAPIHEAPSQQAPQREAPARVEPPGMEQEYNARARGNPEPSAPSRSAGGGGGGESHSSGGGASVGGGSAGGGGGARGGGGRR